MNAARAPQGGDAAVSATAILALALPSSTMFLLATLVGIAMIRFAAALGPDAVAAVNAGARLYNVFIALAAGINAGALALIANAWGAGRRVEAERYLELSLAVAALLGVAITLLTWLGAGPLLGLFDLDPGAHAESVSYTRWLALFYAPIALYLVLASGLRAAGDARTPMLFALLVNGVSLGLAWRWSIAPPFGLQPHVRYIALGLGLGNVAGVVAALALWRAGRLALAPARRDAGSRRRLKALWQVGYPAALEQGLLQLGIIAFLWVVAQYGTAAFTAYGTSISLLSLAMVIGFGFSVAVSVMVGQQLGAGSPANARLVALRALRLTVVTLSVPGLILACYAHPVALWLTGNEGIAAHAVPILYAFTLALPMLAVEFCLGGALRGAGDTRFPLLNVLAGLIVVRFGLALLFYHLGLGVNWIYATLIADYAVKNALLVWRFRSGRWMKPLRAETPLARP
ncbi:MAG: MATE family efflux transporter [Gammaproteobacteria bacterium]|nr:MATE family efflux transporter [Gammaproteobacteria bacterium]